MKRSRSAKDKTAGPSAEQYLSHLTPLMKAAARGNTPEILRLLRSGAKVNEVVSETCREYSKLSPPARGRNLLRPPLFVDLGRTKQSTSALVCAIDHGKYAAIRLLIKHGANTRAPFHVFGGLSDPYYYSFALDPRAFQILCAAGRPPRIDPLLYLATMNGDLRSMRQLLALGANPNARCNGEPLWFAATQPAALNLLIRKGAAPRAKLDGWKYLAQLLGPNEYRVYPLVRIILRIMGRGRIHGAEKAQLLQALLGQRGRVTEVEPIARALLRAGYHPDAAGSDGATPLIEAAKAHGNQKYLRLLLKSGADPSQKDRQGRTALDYARELAVNAPAIRLLQKAMAAHSGRRPR